MTQSNKERQTITSPGAAVVLEVNAQAGQRVSSGTVLFVLESMKLQSSVTAPVDGCLDAILVEPGQTVQANSALCTLIAEDSKAAAVPNTLSRNHVETPEALIELEQRLAQTLDSGRSERIAKRHGHGYRSARENVDDLCDKESFVEYGQLAVAAQRRRRSLEDLRVNTAGDGILTGLATINAHQYGNQESQAVVIVNDYTVLAGTQGFYHHKKLDRALELATRQKLPVVMYTEGGGGRPGDTDVTTQMAGLDVPSFTTWAALSGQVPRIAVNNGYCFAGNAALFGCADVTIATRSSWIGMAGPAMIEGGGLGSYEPTEIGPADVQQANGVIDLIADDEAEATALAKKVLGYFQGRLANWECAEQEPLRTALPADRRFAFAVRPIIETLADVGSVTELRPGFGGAVITAFIRIEGRPLGLICNDSRVIGGAIDSCAAEKAARFIQLCDAFGLPLLSLCDTPGFMVGPESESEAAVRRVSRMFTAGATSTVPIVAIVLRKAYGLGVMAMTGGGFNRPHYMASWPTGEFGGMGLEGAVRLGYSKELAAAEPGQEREALFDKLLAQLYEQGKATEAATSLEIDAVIDPADTRAHVLAALESAGQVYRGGAGRRIVDTW